jgi:hypothetical protein
MLISVLFGTQKSLYGLEEKIASLSVSAAEKRVEVQWMRRENRLSSVVNAQVSRSRDFLNFELWLCSVCISS